MMFCSRGTSTRKQLRRGAVLVCVLVCLTITTLLLIALLKQTLHARRQLRIERNARQTEWLVQAGVERAAFRLAESAEYNGEQWELAADAIVGAAPGTVEISVNREQPGKVRVQIVAEYPAQSEFSIRRTREFLINLPKKL